MPGHPVAGTEHSGPDAGFAELFDNRWCILTPPDGAEPGGGRDGWTPSGRRLGANVETMTPEHHDLVLAITSHLPHLIAYNIVGTADDLERDQSEVMKFSAGGFRDFTRIAASDPTMWRDVFLNNKDAVLEMLGALPGGPRKSLQRAIRWGDGDKLVRAVHPHPRDPPRGTGPSASTRNTIAARPRSRA
jgi:cyclohexadieny/prephenate dehydrogenase